MEQKKFYLTTPIYYPSDVLYLTGDGNVNITRAPKELIIL